MTSVEDELDPIANQGDHYRPGVFLSYPKPANRAQADFIQAVAQKILALDFAPRTLGVSDYNLQAPLAAIRSILTECNGLISVAFRRMHVAQGDVNRDSDLPDSAPREVEDVWFTSPWSQIEPAMAYQMGLPIIMLREKGVVAEGLLQPGIVGLYLPEFDCSGPSGTSYLDGAEWSQIFREWEHEVRSVVKTRGRPPQLY